LILLFLFTGEALTIDLSDFTNQLYALVQSLSLAPEIDAALVGPCNGRSPALATPWARGTTAAMGSSIATTTAFDTASSMTTLASASAVEVEVESSSDLLFRALYLAFAPRVTVPPWRAAAFAKRLLTASLHWPGAVALRALEFVAKLVAREPRLEALLSSEDRTVDGVYRPDVEDTQLSNPFATSAFELHLLRTAHVDARVREAAADLTNYTHT